MFEQNEGRRKQIKVFEEEKTQQPGRRSTILSAFTLIFKPNLSFKPNY